MPEPMAPGAYPIETLVLSDFTQTPNTGAGALQTILQHIVPRGEARSLVRYPGRLTLGKKDAFNGTGAATTFNLTNTPVSSKNFALPARAFVGGVEQTYVVGAPGANQFAVNFVTKVVTFNPAPAVGVNNVEVFYPFQEGKYSILYFHPNERRNETISNGTVRRLNQAPQDDVNSVYAINATTPWLPQDFIIRVQVDSSAIVSFDARDIYTNIELPFTRIPLGALKPEDKQVASATMGA